MSSNNHREGLWGIDFQERYEDECPYSVNPQENYRGLREDEDQHWDDTLMRTRQRWDVLLPVYDEYGDRPTRIYTGRSDILELDRWYTVELIRTGANPTSGDINKPGWYYMAYNDIEKTDCCHCHYAGNTLVWKRWMIHDDEVPFFEIIEDEMKVVDMPNENYSTEEEDNYDVVCACCGDYLCQFNDEWQYMNGDECVCEECYNNFEWPNRDTN